MLRKHSFVIVLGTGLATAMLFAAGGCSSTAMSEEGKSEASSRQTNLADKSKASLDMLYRDQAGAQALGQRAAGVLVFPDVAKAGFLVGGSHGHGTLFKNGQVAGYYKTTAASAGLQAGVQQYGYAIFFMNEKALATLDATNGWEIGSGPNVVMLDKGAAANLTTATADKDIYSIVFDQKGLMAGVDLQGSKISKLNP
jgi:lipid-binding SYLF domain-containing protein